jgi:hypothetical protein
MVMAPIDGITMKFEFTPTFTEHYLATLAVILHSPVQFILSLCLPATGFLIIVLHATHQEWPSPWESFIVLCCLLFTPVTTLINVALFRSRNKTVHSIHQFTINEEGIKIAGPAFEVFLKWPAILMVRETGPFLLFFFGSQLAHFVPKRALSPTDLEHLKAIIHAHTPAA